MKKKSKVGILKNLRKKLGEIMNIVLGKNSATNRIIVAEIIVLRSRITRSESINLDSGGDRRLENTRP